MRAFFLLLCVYSVASSNDKELEEELKRKNIINQITRAQTSLIDGYHLVTRQIATDVYMYRSYRTVSVIFYPIMRDVTEARFTFLSEELHMNNIGSCSPENVVLNLKRGSYPAVNPDGYEFPSEFIDPHSREPTYTIELRSDGKNKTFSMLNPKPGNWYALVYIKWEDPRKQKVEQQGLVANCKTIIYTDLQVKRDENIEVIDCYAGITISYSDIPGKFKCISLDNAEPISFNITINNVTNNNTSLLFKVGALSLPTKEEYLVSCVFYPKLANQQTVTFFPNPNSWHYIIIEESDGARNADCESYFYRTDLEEVENHTIIDLMRDDKGRFFTFDFGLPSPDVHDSTSLLNLTSNEIKSVRFKVNQFIDIGGNLIIEASLLMSLKYYTGYKRPIRKGALLAFTKENQFFKVVVCLDIDHTSIPLETGHCKYNDRVENALFVLNSTDSYSIYNKIIVPYPDGGLWYLTFRLFCDDVVCPCKTSHNGTKYYIESEMGGENEEHDISGEMSNNTREGEKNCNASVVLALHSSSCVEGRCSNHGNCLLNTFGGLVMSFCSCNAGYGGWDCGDQSRMDSLADMLMSILLLTLSNILFVIAIYSAAIRLYYTEAVMYTFTMVFSTFYHACDAPPQVAYCITKGNILQFGDFYCGIMCFWVTLLAMSTIEDKVKSFFQLIGAIVIALLTTWNMHSIVSFMVPVIIGASILLLSWALDWKKHRRFRYPKVYYFRYLPIGVILVSIGLVCFAFLQTELNYKLVHSIWHAIIALSVTFLLPDVKRSDAPNPFLPSGNISTIPFSRIFKSSPSPTTPEPVLADSSPSEPNGVINTSPQSTI